MKKQWLLIPLPFLILIFLFAWIIYAKQPSQETATTQPVDSSETTVADTPLQPAPAVTEPTESTEPTITKVPWTKPEYVKGVYATGWMAGSDKWFPRIIQFINETEVNALVIDVKDDTGTLSYSSSIPLVNQTKAFERKIRDPQKMFALLKENQIYPIARIVVFKDPFMANQKPEWAVKNKNGGLWTDRKGLHWVDPYNKEYWDYIIDISKEAIALGFQEIQYDYVRFTSDGNVKECVYPFNNGNAPEDVIKEFLQYARKQLEPYQVPVSADIFGLTTSADADLGIGQRFEKIAESVDIVCPMVYPSHYIPGNFGLKNPDLQPYETVYRSLVDAKKRLEQAGITTTLLRPWLQDFSLGNPYGRAQIQAQIKAVHDAGLKEWIFWNPSCKYQVEKYR
ncbi:MAG TPA: putative glycoside hydrolase [Bacillota bacterium]|nr:putative glycoside hydrolase [Bacillota bacterium]